MKDPNQKPNGNLPTISESKVSASAAAASMTTNISDDGGGSADQENIILTTSSQSDDQDGIESFPLWRGSVDGWHLSWPIWHMLPRHERKKIAQQHGYKTIGEFEEYMSLQQAVDNSELKGTAAASSSSLQCPYPNESIYGFSPKATSKEDEEDKKTPAKNSNTIVEDLDDEDNDSSEEDDKVSYGKQVSAISSNPEELSVEELMAVGGKLLMIHEELLHKIFAFLPVDTYGALALVSPHWKHLTRTEAVYRRLCERLYLNQSKRRQLHVSSFGGSYRRMLEVRPRVRAAGGCYVLKYAQIKQIQRDMWTEVPVGAVLESIYYRYVNKR